MRGSPSHDARAEDTRPEDTRPGDTRRIKELFLEAVERPGEEREAWLARLRAESPELAAGVERLLQADARGERRVPELLDGLRAGLERALREGGGRAGQVLGDYELLEEVASGGSGIVFRARQVSLDRVVAVKVLRAGRLAGRQEVERFRAEAEAVARLDDPWIVPVYEVGESDAGPYFSMKWVEGGSLADRRGRYAGDPEAAARLVVRIARSVHHAHQRGILHRDLKPSNILLDGAGTPYVADFGIAKRIEGDGETGTGWLAGTPAYMAPEQTSGGRGDPSVTTDVWALGCILHELLAGTPAFRGESITDVLLRVRDGAPDSLPRGTPRDLATIVEKCLSKDPARRYASANALAVDLERWCNDEPILARQTSTPERLLLWSRREPLVAALCLVVAVLLVALAVGGTWASLRLGEHLERAQLAEQDARERLRAALRAQARDRRRERTAGHRAQGLELLRQAAEIRPGPDLRDEAIACLALPDVTLEREWARPAGCVGVSFDRGLARYALAARDGEVVVREVADDALVARLPGAGPSAWVVGFSPDGRRVAVKYHGVVLSEDPSFVLWDLESATPLVTLPIMAQTFDFHPGGATLVVGEPSGTLRELDVETGAELRQARLPGTLYRLGFDPLGERLAVARYPEPSIALYAWPELTEQLLLEREETVFDLGWTPEGGTLLYASADYRIHLLDPLAGEDVRTFAGHVSDVVRIGLCDGTALLASGAWDGTVRLWEFASGEMLVAMNAELRGIGSGGRVGFSTNERGGVLRADQGLVLRTLHGHAGKAPGRLGFSPDGRLLFSAGSGEVLLWDPATGERLARLELPAVESARFDPAGRLLTLGGEEGIQAWTLPAEAADTAALAGAPLPAPERLLDGRFVAVAPSPDGKVLVAQPAEGPLRVVRLDGSAPERRLETFRGARWPEVDPTGRWLAIGNWHAPDVKVRVWDLASGEVVAEPWPEAASARVGFDPAGERLVVGSGRSYRVFRVGSWQEERVFERPIELGQSPLQLAFGPRRTVALLDAPSVVRLHDLGTGERIASFESPRDMLVEPLALDPTGRYLAVGSTQNRIELWDLERTRAELAARGLDGSGAWPFEGRAAPRAR